MDNTLKLKTALFTLAAVFALFCSFPLTAQETQHKSGNSGETKGAYSTPEEIQTQKIAFFTQELQLTTQEAEKFWPLYNEYWNARGNVRKGTMNALKALNDALEATPAKSDSEIKKLSEAYLANYAKDASLLNEYFTKFQTVLPIKKAAKIFNAEEKFRRILIKQLRHHN